MESVRRGAADGLAGQQARQMEDIMKINIHAALAALTLSLAPGGVAPAFASTGEPMQVTVQSLTGIAILSRHGADDGPGHDVGDDGGRGRGGRRNDDGPGHTSLDVAPVLQLARYRADDGADHDAGDDRGRRGRGRRG